MIAQQIINAVSLGGVYALLALGLAIVFSIVGLINFAHGELMTLSGYALLAALVFGLPFPAAVLVAVSCGALAAVAMERVAFRPMRGASVTSLLLTSFAVSSLLKVVFQNGISARPQPVAMPGWMTGAFSFGDFTIGVGPSISIVVSALALIALELFLRRTVTGTAMRAAAEDFNVVRLMGIPASRIIATAFLLSGLLAGLAAMLWVAQRASVDPLMGFTPVLKAFIAAVVGGLGSLPGAVAGGFLLGIIEVLLQATLPAAVAPYRDAIVLSGVIAVLLVRPQGLIPAVRVQRS
ncbi:MAG: branched-chain amino acid ABC transporter permease [Mesorhizobium sp.]|jgi:branched-chain amino acid transport system permease protein|uniref:Branched-chain amino acid transport system permease protein n=2 Tax=Mesorhizobium TaxID=68287 RepID=A0A1G8MWZ5_9HYPH|nr:MULTISPECIES: branched-chain amino acid ABC transporter permease [Mesorhizobium]MCF6103066.1 branched-chain amino acid ABC transporter permease [Mesorhizobium muleiense]MCF6116987.1 branched-chain amino acid ABC transporter permease [Mesorhizobium muleiense]RWB00339.1 MAG: branched-chain amino acid ABC transporter permease [Mesorhizobium sp.]RWO06123.1 MAG: branched-chain amino acid ABC transporter permease [Mesorhizobium sp.]RWP03330.1 MAG: branched-chain amino acid ABC transporter permeas